MKKNILSMLLIAFWCISSAFGADYYVATNGNDSNAGTLASPFKTLTKAITVIQPGDNIYMRGGTHAYSAPIFIFRGANDATASARKQVLAYNNETVIFDFSSMPLSTSNRGIVLDAAYWTFRGLIIEGAGDNGLLLAGNNNIIERCIFRKNRDSGLQLSRYNTSFTTISQWPSNNLILNCEAYDNKDPDSEDADGFAAKLTSGNGNIFRNCVAHHNIDDGWDLYTKSDTGPIGPVTLENCIAHSNGVLTDGATSGNGDKNGFKLGGEDISVNHIVRRCIAFNNGKHGFTFNRNLGTIEMTNNTAFNNIERNFNFDGGTSRFTNNLSFFTATHTADRLIGTQVGTSNAFWTTTNYTVTAADFVSLTPGPNANPTSNGFLNLASSSDLINKGAIVSGITYNGSAPDLGAIEFGGVTPTTYTLAVSASPAAGGTVTKSPNASSYASGTVVTLTAVPASGYTFSGWSGDASGTSASTTVTMNANKTVTSNFTPTTASFTLTTNVAPAAGGTVTRNPNAGSYASGTVVTLTAVPASGYTFSGWSGDASGTSASTTVTMNANKTVTANFTPTTASFTLTTNVAPAAGGTVTRNPNAGSYASGTVVTLTAVPASGYTFSGWSGDASGSSASTTVTMNANKTVTANFSPIATSFTLTTNVVGSGTITRSPNSASYASGTVVTLTAVPASGFTFAGWSGDASGSSATTTVTMNANKTVTATFTQSGTCTWTTIQAESGTRSSGTTIDTDNAGYTGTGFVNTANAVGSWFEVTISSTTAGSKNMRLNYANGTTADRPVSVSVNGTVVVSSLSLPATGAWTTWVNKDFTASLNAGNNTVRFTSLTASGAANADRVEACLGGTAPTSYQLTSSVVGQGSINPSSGSFTSGTVLNLTATPASGWQFSGWSGSVSGTTNPVSLTMNSNKSVTATFTQIVTTTFTLTTSTSGSGSISLNPAGGTYNSGTVVSATATPASGWIFSGWSGAATGSSNPVSITMNANKSLTATFTQSQPNPTGVIGFAGVSALGLTTTTGGTGARVVTPANAAQLMEFMDLNEPLIIQVSGTMNLNGSTTALRSNKTLIGIGSNARIINGGLEIYNRSNIIIRNITFVNSPDDCLKINQNTHHVWVDHCNFTDGDVADPEGSNHDGLFDITRESSYISISYCVFENHAKTILIGHSDGATGDAGDLKVTLHHNWFKGTRSRHPRVRFGEVHVFNNYYSDNDEYGVASTAEADVVVEGNYFKNVLHPTHVGYAESPVGDLVERFNIYDNSGLPETRGTAFDPRSYYNYTLDPTASIPSIVTQNAGVGKITATQRSIVSSDEGDASGLKVFQNFPNPVENSTTIGVWLKEASNVKIDLYSASGGNLGVIADKNMDKGYNEVKFSKNGLTPGLYLYKVQSGNKLSTKQMIVK